MKFSLLVSTMIFGASPLFASADVATKEAKVEIVVEENTPPFTIPEKIYVQSCAKQAHNKNHPNDDDYSVDMMMLLDETESNGEYEYDDTDAVDDFGEDDEGNRGLRLRWSRNRLPKRFSTPIQSVTYPKPVKSTLRPVRKAPPRPTPVPLKPTTTRPPTVRCKSLGAKCGSQTKPKPQPVKILPTNPILIRKRIQQLRRKDAELTKKYRAENRLVYTFTIKHMEGKYTEEHLHRIIKGIRRTLLKMHEQHDAYLAEIKALQLQLESRSRTFNFAVMGKCQRCRSPTNRNQDKSNRRMRERIERSKNISEDFCQCLADSSFSAFSNIQKCSLNFEEHVSLRSSPESNGDDAVTDFDDSEDSVDGVEDSYDGVDGFEDSDDNINDLEDIIEIADGDEAVTDYDDSEDSVDGVEDSYDGVDGFEDSDDNIDDLEDIIEIADGDEAVTDFDDSEDSVDGFEDSNDNINDLENIIEIADGDEAVTDFDDSEDSVDGVEDSYDGVDGFEDSDDNTNDLENIIEIADHFDDGEDFEA